jgi:hypothetical protein
MTVSTHSARDLHARGYRRGQPPWLSLESEGIDRAACGDGICPACGGAGLDYSPWHNRDTSSYVAMAECPACGHSEEF